MVPTKEWMEMKFNDYNTQYFDNRIPQPSFNIISDCKINGMPAWGYYTLPSAQYNRWNRKIFSRDNNGYLSLNADYNRQEKDWCETLLHEMIHAYIILVLKIYPKDSHGQEFQKIAAQINQDGWNITEMTDLKDTDIYDQPNDESTQIENILCVIYKPEGINYKYWLCRCDYDDMNEYKTIVNQFSEKTIISFFKCKSQKLSSLPSDSKTLTGFGGMSYQEAVDKLVKSLDDNITLFSLNNLEKIQTENEKDNN